MKRLLIMACMLAATAVHAMAETPIPIEAVGTPIIDLEAYRAAGRGIDVGDEIPAGDGCNYCTMLSSSAFSCTLLKCIDPPPPPPESPRYQWACLATSPNGGTFVAKDEDRRKAATDALNECAVSYDYCFVARCRLEVRNE